MDDDAHEAKASWTEGQEEERRDMQSLRLGLDRRTTDTHPVKKMAQIDGQWQLTHQHWEQSSGTIELVFANFVNSGMIG